MSDLFFTSCTIFSITNLFINYQGNLYPVLSYTNLIVYLCMHFFNYNFRELYRLRIIDEKTGIKIPEKEKFDKKSYWLVSYPFFDKYKRYEFFIPKGSLSRGD